MPTLSQRYKRPPAKRYSAKGTVPPARRLLQSMVVIVLLTGLKTWWVEKTIVGEQLEASAVNLMQSSLTVVKTDPKVAVVDITDIQMKTNGQNGQSSSLITPRDRLTEVLQQVAQADPAAIGVDILFDPDEEGHLSAEDKDFLYICLHTKNSHNRHIPTFVGVYNLAGDQEAWLGKTKDGQKQPDYSRLGKTVLIPRDENPFMPTAELFKTLTMTVDGKRIEAQSMSDALAHASDGDNPHWTAPEFFYGAFSEKVRTTTDDGITLTRYRLNYGPLDRLIERKVLRNKLPQQSGDLSGKIVLIGRATTGETNDMFTVAAHGEPVPGVFLHAVGVETLLGTPLRTLTPLGHVLMDVLVAAVVALLLYTLDKLYWRNLEREKEEHTYETWAKRCEIGVGLLVLCSGFFVATTHLFWTDYLMVALALFLHGTFEKFFKWTYRSAE